MSSTLMYEFDVAKFHIKHLKHDLCCMTQTYFTIGVEKMMLL